MAEYLQQIKKVVDTLPAVSSLLEEEDVILYILNGLPPEFNSFKMARKNQVSSNFNGRTTRITLDRRPIGTGCSDY